MNKLVLSFSSVYSTRWVDRRHRLWIMVDQQAMFAVSVREGRGWEGGAPEICDSTLLWSPSQPEPMSACRKKSLIGCNLIGLTRTLVMCARTCTHTHTTPHHTHTHTPHHTTHTHIPHLGILCRSSLVSQWLMAWK